MDTVRVPNSAKVPPHEKGVGVFAVYSFLSCFVLFVFGLVTGINVLTGIGLFGFVVAFLYLNENAWKGIMSRKTLRKYFTESRIFRG